MAELAYTLRLRTPADQPAIDRMNARAFGPGRYARSAYRLREGIPPVAALSLVACVGPLLVGSNIMTAIRCGDTPSLLLGPLTVEPAFRRNGIGEALMRRSLAAARSAGHGSVVLVGDRPFYARFGFERVPHGRLEFCGPVDPDRLLWCELSDDTLLSLRGPVRRALP